jgi:putative ABC transport system permease protein
VGSRAGLRVDNTPAAASDYLFGVRATDPITTASVALVLLAVAILASLIPVRRASSVEPASVAR